LIFVKFLSGYAHGGAGHSSLRFRVSLSVAVQAQTESGFSWSDWADLLVIWCVRLPDMPLIIILIVLLILFGGGGYYMGPGIGYYGGGGLSLIIALVIIYLLFGRGRSRL
jgi:hypothetical protein